MKTKLLASLLWVSCCFAEGELELLIDPETIADRVRTTAAQINQAYEGQELTILMILKGAVCVTADLIRELQVPFKLEAIKASSYGENGTKRGSLKISGLDNLDLTGKHLLVVDDIFDSGHTMKTVVEQLEMKQPASVKSLVLLEKKIPRAISYRPDFALFAIENRFVVGYGLDYKELYRGLPGIYAFVNDLPPSE